MLKPTSLLVALSVSALAAVGCAKSPAIQAQIDAQASSTLATAAAPPAVDHELEVTLADFAVTDNHSSVPAGKYTFAISNRGAVQHELLVFRSDLAPSALPMTNGNMNEEGPGVAKTSDGDNIDPGKTQSRDVDLSQPGTYLLICNLPGHLHAGMMKVLTVTQPPAV